MPRIVTRQRTSSAFRCLKILKMLSSAEQDLTLQQIAEATGLHASTAHRLLVPLVNLGFVEQQSDRRYRVGLESVAVGSAFLRRSPIRRAALPFLMRLAEQTRMTINLGFWWGGKVVIVDCLPTGSYEFYEPGNVVSAHATAMGKVFLAFRKSTCLAALGPLDRYTEHTICTQADLAIELEKVRREGVALDDEECLLGCRCLAAPILVNGQEPEAVISVSAPAAMMDERTIQDLAKLLKERSANISIQLGPRFRSALSETSDKVVRPPTRERIAATRNNP